MATPASEIAVPTTVVSVGLAALLGHDATFWVIVLAVTFLKLFTSGPVKNHKGEELEGAPYWRQQFIDFWAAVIPPYVGTDAIGDAFDVTDRPAYYLIAIFLTIAGHGVLQYLKNLSQEPHKLISFIRSLISWRVGK